MKDLNGKSIKSEEFNAELILHCQAKMRECDKVISCTVTPLENPARLKILRNSYVSYLKTKK